MTRPVALPFHAAGVPSALRVERRWCLWCYELQGERWTKRPLRVSGRYAKSNDPDTWTDFDRALWVYERSRDQYAGLGFMLGDGWGGIDVDDANACEPFVQSLPGYMERSPSGTGFKAFGHSTRIGGQANFATVPPTFTTWVKPRFFTVTGQGSGDPSIDITAFVERYFPVPVHTPSEHEGYALASTLSDYDLAIQMFGADNGDKALALWRGDLSAYDNDHSRADLALVTILAFWCNYDMDRVDRMFRESALMRDKWNSGSYRSATFAKVSQ